MSEKKPVRKLSRLEGYDYSENGCYFVTICTKDRKCLLGRVTASAAPIQTHVGAGVLDGPCILLSEIGRIVDLQICRMNEVYSDQQVVKYIIMPNHVHLLLQISSQPVGGGTSRTPSPTNAVLPRWISTFKRYTNKLSGLDLWQRSFYDHIIRDDADYLTHWSYIDGNAQKWETDPLNIHITDKERETI